MRLLGLLILLWTSPALAESISFSDRGTPVKEVDASSVQKLATPKDVRVFEPHAQAEVTYRAVPLPAVLDSVFGARWRKAQLVLFRCQDGYRPAVPVSKILSERGWLAFAFPDGRPFHLKNTLQNEEADLGPLYLVWEDSKQVRADGGADWPYQIVGVELSDFATAFPRIAPPKNASAPAQRGFLTFQRQCLSCHTINGDGGAKAPELNYPVNVTEYWKPEMLKQWIAEPTAIRFSTNMPALDPTLADRAKRIDELVEYLRAMRARKIEPAAR